MTQTITRLYDSYDRATQAVRALKEAGCPPPGITLLARTAAPHAHGPQEPAPQAAAGGGGGGRGVGGGGGGRGGGGGGGGVGGGWGGGVGTRQSCPARLAGFLCTTDPMRLPIARRGGVRRRDRRGNEVTPILLAPLAAGIGLGE